MVDVVVGDVADVVEVDVEVGAAVVTGMVVLVVDDATELELATTTVDDVEPESVVAGSSLLQAPIVNASRTRGARRVDFTVGSLARFVTIT